MCRIEKAAKRETVRERESEKEVVKVGAGGSARVSTLCVCVVCEAQWRKVVTSFGE